jgi:hypothetical protein
MDEIINNILNKPLYSFSSVYGYLFSFQIGNPSLEIEDRKNIKKTIEKYYHDYKYYEQEYYYLKIIGEYTILTHCFWKIMYKNKIICDIDTYDHDETERFYSLYVSGQKIYRLSIKEKYIEVELTNKFILRFYKKEENQYFFITDNSKDIIYSLFDNVVEYKK